MIRAILLAPFVVLALLAGIYLLTPQVDLGLPPPQDRFLDIRADFTCIGSGGSGCYVPQELLDSYKFGFYLRAFDVSRQELRDYGDELVARRMNASIARSRYVRAAVISARDGVVRDGRIDRSQTRMYVPDAFVAQMARKYPHLEYGASIHPDRADWHERLAQAKRDGAVLVSWLPAAMHIDPSDLHYVQYYRALADLGLPLLVRIGGDDAFGHANDAFGDPRKLALPLREGVTVIATHISATAEYDGQSGYKLLLAMLKKNPRLYMDISGLTRINNVGYLTDALAFPGARDRMLYGSDWPLQFFPLVSPFYQWPDVDLPHAKTIQNIGNEWDRDVALKMALGVPGPVFRRSVKLLASRPTPAPRLY
ncbi:MAG: amidohydrolase family protein [Arenicellales bacterium]